MVVCGDAFRRNESGDLVEKVRVLRGPWQFNAGERHGAAAWLIGRHAEMAFGVRPQVWPVGRLEGFAFRTPSVPLHRSRDCLRTWSARSRLSHLESGERRRNMRYNYSRVTKRF